MKNVEIRNLGGEHLLSGQQGLFATHRFARFDILGEYRGRIVPEGCGGCYCAALEDRPAKESLGVDASVSGNEARFINCYYNIADEPNLYFRTAYIDSYPRLLLVCIKDIEVNEELLLDYGESYITSYLTPKPAAVPYSVDQLKDSLPLMLDSDDEEV